MPRFGDYVVMGRIDQYASDLEKDLFSHIEANHRLANATNIMASGIRIFLDLVNFR